MLFTREGKEFTGNVSYDDNGKAVRFVNVTCDRCHVINGQRLWVMGTMNGQPYSLTGFECWTCGNTGIRGERKERLFTEVELARVNKAAATREANRAAKAAAAAEESARNASAEQQAFLSGNADFIAKLQTLTGDFWTQFCKEFMGRMKAPTERQIALVEGEVAKRAKNASSAFVGSIGSKVEMTITVERIIVLQSQFYGTNYITIARDQRGNVITYKGLVDLGAVGDTNTIKATIKDHEMYQGVAQTSIQRPKVVEMA
jgi:hypothetical protein